MRDVRRRAVRTRGVYVKRRVRGNGDRRLIRIRCGRGRRRVGGGRRGVLRPRRRRRRARVAVVSAVTGGIPRRERREQSRAVGERHSIRRHGAFDRRAVASAVL